MLMSLRQLLQLIRFSHTLFALPFALLAAVLAWRETDFRPQDLIGIMLCMVFARSAAMAFNRLVDRKIDAENPRTAGRHLPAGLLSVPLVILFTFLCSAGFISSTLLFLPNRWPIILAVPVLAFLLGYSYAKRFTVWSHYWLSAALMLSPIAAWIAITGRVDLPPLILAGVVFFYACQDVEFDREKSLFSIPSRWGIPVALRFALVSHLLMIGCLFGLWYAAALGDVFLAGILAVTGLLVYEHWLVRPEDLTRVNIAFFQVNAIISLGLFLVGAADVNLDTKSNPGQKPETNGNNPITMVSVPNAATSAAGTIEGTVIYKADPKRKWRYARYYIEDRKQGHLAEAVVGLRSTKLKKLAPPSKPKATTIDQKETRFTPETVAIRSGDSVRFTNSDPFIHNVHTSNPLCRFDDSIKTGQSFSQTFTRAGGIRRPIVLGCRFHSVMQAWVFVFDHPWFQLTSTDGRFRLDKVPPGTYQLRMSHPAGDLQWSKKVEVKAGETVIIDIRVTPDNLSY